VRKVSLGWGIAAAVAFLAVGCKSTSNNTTAANAEPLNGSGTRSAMVATADDPLSLNKKAPPPGADLYVSTAHAYEATHNFASAKDQYERALKVDPAYLPALLGYAHLLDTQKEFTDADQYYAVAAKKHGDMAAVFNDWGMSQQRRGHLDESAKLLTKATKLQPDKKLYRNNLAMVLVVMHRPQEAYRQLVAIESPAVAHYNLGALLHRAGDDQMAAYHFVEASKLDPSWPQARRWAEQLGGAGGLPPETSLAMTGRTNGPPPDPRPDQSPAQYVVASRPPVVEAPAGTQQSEPPATPLPEPVPQTQYDASNGIAPGMRPSTVYPEREAIPAYQGAMPGPVVTPTSGISYPTQYPAAAGAGASSSTDSSAADATPPLPPSGASPAGAPDAAGSSAGIAPLPPVR
jgi:Tfp pilus assembly protein PilF